MRQIRAPSRPPQRQKPQSLQQLGMRASDAADVLIRGHLLIGTFPISSRRQRRLSRTRSVAVSGRSGSQHARHGGLASLRLQNPVHRGSANLQPLRDLRETEALRVEGLDLG